MSVDFDAKLTDRAAGIWRDAAWAYDPGAGLHSVLALSNTGMLNRLDATGALPAATGSFASVTGSFPIVTGLFPALTDSFPAVTGSFPAATGSFPAVGPQVGEAQVTLKRAFRLPGKLPGVRLLPEQELTAMARSAPIMTSLAVLAQWLGQDGRLVTRNDDLADDDVADACRRLGIGPGSWSFLWRYALTSGWIELEESADRRVWAVLGATARRWTDGDDSGTLHAWAAVFAAVSATALDAMAAADPRGARKLDFQGQGAALAVLLFPARQGGMTGRDAEDLVRDAAIGTRPSFRRKRAWNAWVQEHGNPAHRLLGELTAIRAVIVPRDATGIVNLSPLGLWALRKQFALEGIRVPALRPPSPRMPAADLVALFDAASTAEFDSAFASWMHGRDPEQAVRELLIYAGASDAHGRLIAVDIARRIGVAGHLAWKDAVKRPELRGYARITLSMMAGQLPESALALGYEQDPDDTAWLATDLLANACDTDRPDPNEVAAQFAGAVPHGEEERILGLMAQGSHPDTARVLDMLGTCHPDRRVAREARRAARAVAKHRVRARAGVR